MGTSVHALDFVLSWPSWAVHEPWLDQLSKIKGEAAVPNGALFLRTRPCCCIQAVRRVP
jgi:hypothetical protein